MLSALGITDFLRDGDEIAQLTQVDVSGCRDHAAQIMLAAARAGVFRRADGDNPEAKYELTGMPGA